MPQVPLPNGDVWVQFPLVALIVAVMAVAAVAIFFFTKWVVGKYENFHQADLEWRDAQNKAREAAAAEQNQLWRDEVARRDARFERYDRERQGSLVQISASMAGIIKQIQEHDAQAREILIITRRVDENTRPIPGK